ncbi:DNA repair exonuclease SbcCD nuclease subunit [Scopulibacillus daqui]|uniref:DNA repair exonuclease SbcCD nuclease subunit n=2 Tax=Scopulibacillus daqui TaxID=1469162 RepID=A0ABS2Q512_9BACL|nr:DNA repair exonuclease SbcCD nuclease subunit [Scopulibacillus daqui]
MQLICYNKNMNIEVGSSDLSIRFIHAADCHLDRPFSGVGQCPPQLAERFEESTFTALERVIQKAVMERVDFIIFAGDIYDQSHRSLRAQKRFAKNMSLLKEHGIDVYIIHGNHDFLDNNNHLLTLPDNVHVFGPTVSMMPFEKQGRPRVHLYGFSYPERHVHDDMSAHFHKVDGADFHIGILHGSVQGNKQHEVYAPFTVKSLIEKDFDYWALGHIHKRQTLSEEPPIHYPGNIQGLNIKESGDKGALLVELDRHKTEVSFFKTADIIWIDETVSIVNCPSIDRLIDRIETLKESIRREEGVLARVTFAGQGPLHHLLYEEAMIEEMLEALRDGEDEIENFVWLMFFQLKTKPEWDREQLMSSPYFTGDLLRLSCRETSIKPMISDLFSHRRAKKYLDRLNKDEEAGILREAETLLIDALYDLEKGEEND